MATVLRRSNGDLPALHLSKESLHRGRHRPRGRLALLPSEFDLAQPFVLEFELSPGRYTFYSPPRIGAAAR